LKIARELERGRVERVIECELRRRDEVRFIVVTNDVFLAERLTSKGGVLVLSYRQMEHMF
jgi:rRNA-processing protein FCF1